MTLCDGVAGDVTFACRPQIYKLADDFTFSGSEETFSQLQAKLEGREARRARVCAAPAPGATAVVAPRSHCRRGGSRARTPLVTAQIDEALLTASAFSNMLNLHNLSEEVANSERERMQRLGEMGRGPVKTTNGTLETLLDAGIPAESIFKCLCEQTVDLVFTAHPTQVGGSDASFLASTSTDSCGVTHRRGNARRRFVAAC